jgi:hypothetical protein
VCPDHEIEELDDHERALLGSETQVEQNRVQIQGAVRAQSRRGEGADQTLDYSEVLASEPACEDGTSHQWDSLVFTSTTASPGNAESRYAPASISL